MKVMSARSPELPKNVKGILMKSGRFLCLRCFDKDPSPLLGRRRHLESRIGPVYEKPVLKEIGLVITEAEGRTDDFYICDKCGEHINSGPEGS